MASEFRARGDRATADAITAARTLSRMLLTLEGKRWHQRQLDNTATRWLRHWLKLWNMLAERDVSPSLFLRAQVESLKGRRVFINGLCGDAAWERYERWAARRTGRFSKRDERAAALEKARSAGLDVARRLSADYEADAGLLEALMADPLYEGLMGRAERLRFEQVRFSGVFLLFDPDMLDRFEAARRGEQGHGLSPGTVARMERALGFLEMPGVLDAVEREVEDIEREGAR